MTTVNEALAALREQWGERWQVWYVPRAVGGGPTWHARRHGDHIRNVINAGTPEHLSEYLAEAEASG